MISKEKVEIRNSTKSSLSWKFVLCLVLLIASLSMDNVAHANNNSVHAILFYSTSCPHCHQVITQDIPPLIENFQEQLSILAINTSSPEGQVLFQAAVDFYDIALERQGVPMLLVGDVVLVGSVEIPDRFPLIVADGLAQGGIDWPDFPQLLSFLDEQNLISTDELEVPEEVNVDDGKAIPLKEASAENTELVFGDIENLTVTEIFAQDYFGNSISVIVLIGMILVIGDTTKNLLQPPSKIRKIPLMAAPILIVIGICVAIYMGYVEITQTDAICGPVGDCNTVQQSSYATFLGIIPIGVLGTIGYLVIALTWFLGNFGSPKRRKLCIFTFFALTFFGTVFSIYLTFLEPFIIGASCAWCLTSAIVMTLLLMYSQSYVFPFGEV